MTATPSFRKWCVSAVSGSAAASAAAAVRRGALPLKVLRIIRPLLSLGIALGLPLMSPASKPVSEAVRFDQIKVSVTPEKTEFGVTDPFGFRMKVENLGDRIIGFKTGNTNAAGNKKSADSIVVNITHERGGEITTETALLPMFEPVGDFQGRMEIYSLSQPVVTPIVPGGFFETVFYLEADIRKGWWLSRLEGPYSLQVFLRPYQFEVDGKPLGIQVRVPDPNLAPSVAMHTISSNDTYVSKPEVVVASNIVTFTVSPGNKSHGKRVYYDALRGWWEWIRVTLTDDKRFEYRSFSDAGGERPVVKGTYRETDVDLILEPIVNANSYGFIKHRTWKKVLVKDKWAVFMLPSAAAQLLPGDVPTTYPVLYPVDPKTTATVSFRRPWEASVKSK